MIDSPPVLGLADSLLISEHVDGMIVLVGLQAVDRSLPKDTINRIKSVGTNLYGIVTNETKKERITYPQNMVIQNMVRDMEDMEDMAITQHTKTTLKMKKSKVIYMIQMRKIYKIMRLNKY